MLQSEWSKTKTSDASFDEFYSRSDIFDLQSDVLMFFMEIWCNSL